MKGYSPETFGELNADVYDSWYGSPTESQTLESVDALADLAAGGAVLELAVGTGRLTLPLAAKGICCGGLRARHRWLHRRPGGAYGPRRN